MVSLEAQELEKIIKLARECGYAESKLLTVNTPERISAWEQEVARIIRKLAKKLVPLDQSNICKNIREGAKVYSHFARSRFADNGSEKRPDGEIKRLRRKK